MNVDKVVLISCVAIFGFFAFCSAHDEDNSLFEFNYVANLDARCLKCICHGATGCNETLACAEVQGYCGPFKVSKVYWVDTGRVLSDPNEDPNGDNAFENCAINYDCATRMVKNYMIKYGRDCNLDSVTDCYDFLMLHYNGGFSCHRRLEREPNGAAVLQRFQDCWEN